MALYSYNGFIGPELPGGNGAAIIAGGELWYSSGGFYIFSKTDNDIVVKKNSTLSCYRVNGNKWEQGAVAPLFPGNTEHIKLAISGISWSSLNVYYYKDQDEIAFRGTIPEYYSPNVPKVTLTCYGRTEITLPFMRNGWYLQARLELSISEGDGSSREIKWYKNGIEFAGGATIATPLCDSIGTDTYCATVTDTGHNGRSVTGTSNSVTVKVINENFNWSGGGNTEEGIPWPDIVTPYPESSPLVETPTILSCGKDAIYEQGENADFLSCVAAVSDGGTLSYEWYEDCVPKYNTPSIRPPTDEVGVKAYFCVVTNTLNGETASAVSEVVVITVWSEETGGDPSLRLVRFQSGIAAGLSCVGLYEESEVYHYPKDDGFLKGVEIGRKLNAKQLGTMKEPIGYLYGETYDGDFDWLRTPYHAALPSDEEWDRTECPYAVMYFAYFGLHILFVSKEPWYGTGEPYIPNGEQFGETIKNASSGLWFKEEASGDIAPNGYQKKIWKLTDNEDHIFAELGQNRDTDGDGIYDYGASGLINWSNHDIISADGKTVLIAASDPISVYE